MRLRFGIELWHLAMTSGFITLAKNRLFLFNLLFVNGRNLAEVVKINVDAAIDAERMGLGVIVRDDYGFVLGGFGCSDNADIVNRIISKGQDITFIGQRANDIYLQLKTFEAAVITWAPRPINKLADFICKFVLSNNCIWNFDVNYPKEIHDLVILDAINES
ncbi:hypothetical protein Godav_014052 [Gossypium davidsonii]|uniref:RNase H type-1 domain-containing protein n=1 Tax=Gossypium davidsonii TaxID=34287 RepID=A0A7J8RIM2_GOSDV|nr:hypothetical protein [Gossypium davidsonii]